MHGQNHIKIDIFVNYSWVVTRWQQYSTHLHTNSTQNDTIILGRVWAVRHLCELYPGICLTTEEKARKILSQGLLIDTLLLVPSLHCNTSPHFTTLHALSFPLHCPLISLNPCTRVGTLIVATIYLQLIQNRYMFRSLLSFNVVTSLVYNPLPVASTTRAVTERQGLYDMIYLSTAIGLTPGGSGTVHTINTQDNTNNRATQ